MYDPLAVRAVNEISDMDTIAKMFSGRGQTVIATEASSWVDTDGGVRYSLRGPHSRDPQSQVELVMQKRELAARRRDALRGQLSGLRARLHRLPSGELLFGAWSLK